MINKGNKHGSHRIKFTYTTPGNAKEKDAYMSELTGIYHITSIIKKICEKHNIRSRGITDACDGINAIIRAMNANTTYLCYTNNFELILAIDKNL